MQVYFLITNQCNLKCKMCIRGERSNHYMDYATFCKTLENFNCKDDIIISGGECTLHPDFISFVNKAKDVARRVIVASNGVKFDCLDEIADIENLHIQISLDGEQKKHDLIRGNGSFKKTMKTLAKIESKNVSYNIASVVNVHNKNDVYRLIPALAEMERMKYWKISYEMPFGNARKQDVMLVEEWNEYVDSIVNAANFRLKVKKIYDFELYRKAIINNQINFDKCMRNCGGCTDKVYIDTDFRVYPCACLMDFEVGNLKLETMRAILDNDKSSPFKNYQVDKCLPCNGCEFYKMCYGGCIGFSYSFFGELGKGDIRCPKVRDYYGV